MSEPFNRIPITIEAAPDGLHITIAYDGTLASIPAAIERLRAAGVLDLVKGANTPARKPAQRVTPAYDGSGDPICPVHRKPLTEGRYGLYCPAKAKEGEQQNDKGYCSLKFTDE